MPFATIAGITVLFVSFRRRNVQRGEDVRAFNNNLLVGSDAGKREWDGETLEMTATDADTLRTAIAATSVTCSGDAFRGASVTCRVTETDAPFQRMPGPAYGFKESLSLLIREV